MLTQPNNRCLKSNVLPRTGWCALGAAIICLLLSASGSRWTFAQYLPPADVAGISPVEQITDSVLFEDVKDHAKQLYLPRFRLATQTVSGDSQYRVRLVKEGSGANLVVYLEKYPAPELGDAARKAQEIAFQTKVVLRYELPARPNSGRSDVYKELIFQDLTSEKDGLKAVLHLRDLQERDELAYALESTSYHAKLLVQRTLKAATRPQGEIARKKTDIDGITNRIQSMIQSDSRCRNINKARWNTMVAENDINVLTQSETTAHRDCLTYYLQDPAIVKLRTDRNNLHGQLYKLQGEWRSLSATLDDVVPKQPFTFDRQRHSYVFTGIVPNPDNKPQLVRKQAPFENRYYSYFRAADRNDLWYYVPDRFVLGKKKNGDPALSVEFKGAEDNQKADLEYDAVPDTQSERLKAAEETLRPTAATKITFEPLLVTGAQVWLRLPGEGSDGPFQKREGASVDLRNGVKDRLSLSLPAFQEIYAALFGTSTLLTGEVRFAPDGTIQEAIPVELRVAGLTQEELLGKVLSQTVMATYQKTIDVKADPSVFRNGVRSLVVDFRESNSVELEPETCRGEGSQKKCAVKVAVRLPVRDFILNTENKGEYHYRVTAVREQGGNTETAWKTASATILYVGVP
jgi:hypothetical protein